MAKIGELLGWGRNPVYQAFAGNRNAVAGAVGGMAADPMNPWGGFARGAHIGGQMDTLAAEQQRQQAQAESERQMALDYFTSKGYQDLVPLFEAGQGEAAFAEAIRRGQPQAPDYTAEQKNFLFAQQNPDFAGFLSQGSNDPTTAMQEYEFAKSQGYNGDFTSWKTDIARAGASNMGMNNSEALAAGYADRMASSNAILADPKVQQSMIDPGQSAANSVPFANNFITSNERKMAEQAKRDFINAILRRESGAAIAPSEFESADKQYFPQPGDTPEVIAQKAANRDMAIRGVARAAGTSYQAPALNAGAGWQVLGVE